MKRFSFHWMWYSEPYYYIIPTIKFCKFNYGSASWTIDFCWLRVMITLARLNHKKENNH